MLDADLHDELDTLKEECDALKYQRDRLLDAVKYVNRQLHEIELTTENVESLSQILNEVIRLVKYSELR